MALEPEIIYNNFITEKGLKYDHNQLELINLLNQYKNALEEDSTHSILNKVLSSVFSKQKKEKRGVYIHGDVGRGKSMIMDLFFNNLALEKKRRVHFHQFMLDFHAELHNWREKNKDSPNTSDPIPQIAKEISKETLVLCLDELQVNNIADAMVVGRLFQALLDGGTFIVITSNRPPHELFQDGLQRERFIPFIELIEKQLSIFHLNSFKDYRLDKLTGLKKMYFSPLNETTKSAINSLIKTLTGRHTLERREIFVSSNRTLHPDRTYGNVAVFTFNELCAVNFGAIDYIAIARNFNTVIIENIPSLNSDNHNEALRFITLIDCLYENHTRLICSSEVEINQIYRGTKNRFEFDRTLSRLQEMQSLEYIRQYSKEALL